MQTSRIQAAFEKNALINHLVLLAKTAPSKSNTNFTVQHMKDCIMLPTTGLLARENYKRYLRPGRYERNLNIIRKKSDEYNAAKKNFDKRFKELYPKTGAARRFLINSGSIVIEKIKPIKNTIERSLFKLFGVDFS